MESDVPALGALGLLTARDARRPVRELSVGQQRRLDLAVLLATRRHVELLDEPATTCRSRWRLEVVASQLVAGRRRRARPG